MSASQCNINLLGMFKQASKKLKHPAITFPYKDHKIRMSLASKGYVAVKIDGEYQGRIDFNPVTNKHEFKMYFCDNDLKLLVESMYHNPAEELSVTGQSWGRCCFCGLELIEKASVYWGYGPICAENYGLPHSLPEEKKINYDDVEI